MLRPPACALAQPLGQTAKSEVKPGEITAASSLLPGVFFGYGLTGHITRQAVPPVLAADELSNRVRYHPSRLSQVPEHLMLVVQLFRGRVVVIAAQDKPLSSGQLKQPAAVLIGHVLQHQHPLGPDRKRVEQAGRQVNRHGTIMRGVTCLH